MTAFKYGDSVQFKNVEGAPAWQLGKTFKVGFIEGDLVGFQSGGWWEAELLELVTDPEPVPMDDRERIQSGASAYFPPDWVQGFDENSCRRAAYEIGAMAEAAHWEQRVRPLLDVVERTPCEYGCAQMDGVSLDCELHRLWDDLWLAFRSGGKGEQG